MPDSIRFLFAILVIGGLAYAALWGLANFPPEQTEFVKPLPHEKLRQR